MGGCVVAGLDPDPARSGHAAALAASAPARDAVPGRELQDARRGRNLLHGDGVHRSETTATAAAGGNNGHDGRRHAAAGRYRRATFGAGRGRDAAGAARLSGGDRARAAPAARFGRANARSRVLSHGDPALAGRPAGRSADLHCASSNCWPRDAARSAGTSPTTASANSSRSGCRTRACRRSTARARHGHGRHRRAGRRHRRCRSMAAIASPATGPSAAAARRAPGCWEASRSSTTGSRGAGRTAARCTGAGCFRARKPTVVPGSWDVAGLRGTGSFDWTVKDVFLPERRTMVACRRAAGQSVVALAGHHLCACRASAGSGRTTAR